MAWRSKRWLPRAETVEQVAFLGAGNMGSAMVGCLLDAGFPVRVYNRTQSRLAPLVARGAIAAETPAAAARGAEIVISMVTDDAASARVWMGEAGAFSAVDPQRAICIEASTISVSHFNAPHSAATQQNIQLVDCPVAGRPDAAARSELAVYAGADADLLARIAPVLKAYSARILPLGPVGAGIAFKLIYNAVGAVQVAAIGEAMALCAKAKIDLNLAADAFRDGATGSRHTILHAGRVAQGTFPRPADSTPQGRIKDLSYATDLASALGLETRNAQAALSAFSQMLDPEFAELSDSELAPVLIEKSTETQAAPSAVEVRLSFHVSDHQSGLTQDQDYVLLHQITQRVRSEYANTSATTGRIVHAEEIGPDVRAWTFIDGASGCGGAQAQSLCAHRSWSSQ